MGSLEGHLVPGTIFILISLWWYTRAVVLCLKRRKERVIKRVKSKDAVAPSINRFHYWFPVKIRSCQLPVEPVAKTFLATCGVALELIYERQYTLLDEKGNFVQIHLNNYAHATMYSIFALSGVLDLIDFYSLLRLPEGTTHFILGWAFFVEGLLFYNHLHGRSSLDVHFHSYIYFLAFATAIVLLLEVAITNPLPMILRAYLTSIHGTWFYQIGFALHFRSPWRNNTSNVEFITIALVWHMISVFVLYTVIYAIIHQVTLKRMKITELNKRILESDSESEFENK